MLGFSSLSLQLKPALLCSAASNQAQLRWRLESGCRPSSPSEGHRGNTQRNTNGECFIHKHGPCLGKARSYTILDRQRSHTGLLRNKIQNSAPCWKLHVKAAQVHSTAQDREQQQQGKERFTPNPQALVSAEISQHLLVAQSFVGASHPQGLGIPPHFWGVTLLLALW